MSIIEGILMLFIVLCLLFALGSVLFDERCPAPHGYPTGCPVCGIGEDEKLEKETPTE